MLLPVNKTVQRQLLSLQKKNKNKKKKHNHQVDRQTDKQTEMRVVWSKTVVQLDSWRACQELRRSRRREGEAFCKKEI